MAVGFLERVVSPLRAATPENPRFSLYDPAAWDMFLGGNAASSGIPVTRETALTYSPWWRGLNLLSRGVGKVPLLTYKKKADGKSKELDRNHRAYYLLRRKPNQYQTASVWKQVMTGHAIGQGNGYSYINRDGAGRPVELLILDPDTTFPVRENGRLLYVVRVATEKRKIDAENVLHIRGFSHDGIQGVSVMDKAREALGLGLGRHKWETIYFKNNARPSVTLETPGRLDEKTKVALRESWERMHGGLENAHRTAILDQGLKASIMSFSAEDSQLAESKLFSIRDIANFIGIQPHKIGDRSTTSYASLEQSNQEHIDDDLDPWFDAWECECWDKLLAEDEKDNDTHEFEFFRRALERADLAAKANYHRTALGGQPWETPNEAREDMGLDPSDEPEADEIPKPLNMGKGGIDNGETGQPEPKPGKAPGQPKPLPPPKSESFYQALLDAPVEGVTV